MRTRRRRISPSAPSLLPTCNPDSCPPENSPYTPDMDARDRLAAWLKPEDVEPALRLLTLMEAYGKIGSREAEDWRRRITGWARFNAVEAGAEPSA